MWYKWFVPYANYKELRWSRRLRGYRTNYELVQEILDECARRIRRGDATADVCVWIFDTYDMDRIEWLRSRPHRIDMVVGSFHGIASAAGALVAPLPEGADHTHIARILDVMD